MEPKKKTPLKIYLEDCPSISLRQSTCITDKLANSLKINSNNELWFHLTSHYHQCRLRILRATSQMSTTLVDNLQLWELFALSLNQLQWQKNQQPHRAEIHGTSYLQVSQEQRSCPHSMMNEQQMLQLLYPKPSPIINSTIVRGKNNLIITEMSKKQSDLE